MPNTQVWTRPQQTSTWSASINRGCGFRCAVRGHRERIPSTLHELENVREVKSAGGGTIGGPIRSNRVFFFAGYDQHIFHVPTVVNFLSGGSVLVPQAGSGPLQPGDYEDNDKTLVFAAAAQLNQAGNYPADLLGNAGFFKLDATLNRTPSPLAAAEHFALLRTQQRLPRSRQPGHEFGISDNGEEDVTTETASTVPDQQSLHHGSSAICARSSRATCSLPRANRADPLHHITEHPRRLRPLHPSFPARPASTACISPKLSAWKATAIPGSSAATCCLPGSTTSSPRCSAASIFYDPIKVDPLTFEPHALRPEAHAPARLRAPGPALLHPEFRLCGHPSRHQRVRRLRAGHDPRHRPPRPEPGRPLRPADFTTKDLVSNPLWPMSGKVRVKTAMSRRASDSPTRSETSVRW